MTITWPTPPDSALRAAFHQAVRAGEPGQAEYTTWLKAWDDYETAFNAARQADWRRVEDAKAAYSHLYQEARRLNALEDKIGYRIDSADRNSTNYTPARHEAAKAKWRADLAAYSGEPVSEDAPVTVEAVPLPPLPQPSYFVDLTNRPGPYSTELDAALNAAVARSA